MRSTDPARAVFEAVAVVVVVVLVDLTAAGFVLFTNAAPDELEKADAILVLAGEHDGREDHGVALARAGWAPTVVLSNPYPSDDEVMDRVCDGEPGVEVICVRPDLLTTRGEAIAMRALADERSWRKIIVVTWRYHMPRARFIFRQCYSARGDDTVMTAVPRSYDFSVPEWELTYAYQFAGFAKAAIQGDCS
ncbi:YdcF family protein [Mycolicibacterium flavescens]|uniref:DUF218 domain-containing protein n=1 Tax=Mycolicibacterium flavescens TaxID=1776 RepID=A0A1E3RH47_MYCFV|nr:YdcF family protein [Mycolicibacterium flavescens]MCV7283149.1 YdcF family protein [Mycolicibacterium flavescens]ODQ89188.1 hypothetical protein BHQ18_16520 [Mycolicibacterium flavescens]